MGYRGKGREKVDIDESMLDLLPSAMGAFVFNSQGEWEVLYLNDGWLKMFKKDGSEFEPPKGNLEPVAKEDHPKLGELIENAMNTEKTVSDIIHICTDGVTYLPYNMRIRKIPTDASQHTYTKMIYFFIDEVTDKNKMNNYRNENWTSEISLLGTRVLIADDDEICRNIVSEILAANGCFVYTATNGADAVGQYESHQPWYYDLILMDIRMPEIDGYEASRRIRAMQKEDSRRIPIVAMTADDMESRAYFSSGMDDFISKPVSQDVLLDTISSIIRNSHQPV